VPADRGLAAIHRWLKKEAAEIWLEDDRQIATAVLHFLNAPLDYGTFQSLFERLDKSVAGVGYLEGRYLAIYERKTRVFESQIEARAREAMQHLVEEVAMIGAPKSAVRFTGDKVENKVLQLHPELKERKRELEKRKAHLRILATLKAGVESRKKSLDQRSNDERAALRDRAD
jgi:hypothetical protein